MKTRCIRVVALIFAVVGGATLLPCSGQAQNVPAPTREQATSVPGPTLTQTTPDPMYSNTAFDYSASKLLANYNGIDPFAVVKALVSRFPDKTEFETTDAYNIRIQKAQSPTLPLLGSLTLQSPMAFQVAVDGATLVYHADQKQMQVNLDTRGNSGFLLRKTSRIDGAYEGHNNLGATTEVTKVYKSFTSVEMVNAKEFHFKWNIDMSEGIAMFNVSMDAAMAQLAKPNVRVLVVCQLSGEKIDLGGPYLAANSDNVTPTIDRPIEESIGRLFLIARVNELLIYNVATGEIYQTIKSKSFTH